MWKNIDRNPRTNWKSTGGEGKTPETPIETRRFENYYSPEQFHAKERTL
jgi:hypothetical protein